MATIFQKKDRANQWVCQWLDSKGKRKSKIFSGPDAELNAKKWKFEFEKESIAKEEPTKEKREVSTLSELWEHWKVRKAEKKSLYKDIQNYNKHLFPFFGNCELNSIKRVTCNNFMTHLQDKKLAPNTCNINRSLLSGLLNEAYKNEWIDRVPSIEKEKISENTKDFFQTEEESDLFIDTASKLIPALPDSVKAIYMFALHSGCRPIEIRNLIWSNLFLEGDKPMIKIQNRKGFKTKTGKNREIPINDRLLETLKWWKERYEQQKKNMKFQTEYVFPTRSGASRRESDRAFKDMFKLVKEKCGMGNRESLTFYSFRHTKLTRWLESGIPATIVQRMAGHQNFSTTLIYASHVSLDLDLSKYTNMEREEELNGQGPSLHTL